MLGRSGVAATTSPAFLPGRELWNTSQYAVSQAEKWPNQSIADSAPTPPNKRLARHIYCVIFSSAMDMHTVHTTAGALHKQSQVWAQAVPQCCQAQTRRRVRQADALHQGGRSCRPMEQNSARPAPYQNPTTQQERCAGKIRVQHNNDQPSHPVVCRVLSGTSRSPVKYPKA